MDRPIYILAGQSNAVNMEDEFLYHLSEVRKTHPYYGDCIASGGAPLTRERGREDWAGEGEMREDLVEMIVDQIKADPDARLDTILWVQGEADTRDDNAEHYFECITELVDEVKSELAKALPGNAQAYEDFDFKIVTLSENAPGSAERQFWDEVRAQHFEAAEMHENISVVCPDEMAEALGVSVADMFQDGLHYSSGFQDKLMQAVVQSINQDEPETGGEDDDEPRQNLEVEAGFWVYSQEGDEAISFQVEAGFECAGLGAKFADGDHDRIEFEDTSAEDWIITHHKDDADCLVFRSQSGEDLLFIKDAKNIEEWVFEDEDPLSFDEIEALI